jgi:putative hydrolase of the HAD superfamily
MWYMMNKWCLDESKTVYGDNLGEHIWGKWNDVVRFGDGDQLRFYGNLDTVLQEFHLDNIFDVVVESAAVGVRKPDPAIYRLALTELECNYKTQSSRFNGQGSECNHNCQLSILNSQITVVGDSMKNDIQPAKELGLYTIQISGEPWDNINTTGISADRVITNLKELL